MMRFLCQVSSFVKFTTFLATTALQHCKLNCPSGGGMGCRGLVAVDTPNQFPNYVVLLEIGRMVYTFPLKTARIVSYSIMRCK